MKPVLVVLSKLAVSAALIALIARAVDLREIASHLAQVDIAGASIAIGITAAAIPLHALRWLFVLEECGTRLHLPRVMAIVLIGHFFNQTLPSSVGGDTMRIWCAYRSGMAPVDAVASVVLDRAASLAGLLLLVAFGLPWLLGVVPDPGARIGIVGVVVAGLTGLFMVAVVATYPRLLPQWRIIPLLQAPAALARRVLLSPHRLLPVLALAVASGAVFSFVVFQLGRTLNAGLALTDCLLLVPPVLLVSAIPVSVAGWGLREGAMVVALGFVGVAPATAFAISVLFGIVIAVASLPGVGFWLASGYSFVEFRRNPLPRAVRPMDRPPS